MKEDEFYKEKMMLLSQQHSELSKFYLLNQLEYEQLRYVEECKRKFFKKQIQVDEVALKKLIQRLKKLNLKDKSCTIVRNDFKKSKQKKEEMLEQSIESLWKHHNLKEMKLLYYHYLEMINLHNKYEISIDDILEDEKLRSCPRNWRYSTIQDVEESLHKDGLKIKV